MEIIELVIHSIISILVVFLGIVINEKIKKNKMAPTVFINVINDKFDIQGLNEVFRRNTQIFQLNFQKYDLEKIPYFTLIDINNVEICERSKLLTIRNKVNHDFNISIMMDNKSIDLNRWEYHRILEHQNVAILYKNDIEINKLEIFTDKIYFSYCVNSKTGDISYKRHLNKKYKQLNIIKNKEDK